MRKRELHMVIDKLRLKVYEQEELLKIYRKCACGFCDEHIKVKQKSCPVCELNSIRSISVAEEKPKDE